MSETPIYQFLNTDESQELVRQLKSIGVNARTLPMNSESLDINQVFVQEADVSESKAIVEKFRKTIKSNELLNKYTCSKCKSNVPYIAYKEDISFLKRILSIGTKTLRCKKCGNEWYV